MNNSKTNKSLVTPEKQVSTRDLIYILNAKIEKFESLMNEENKELFELALAELRSIEQMLNDALRTDNLMTPFNVRVIEAPQKNYWNTSGIDENGVYWDVLYVPGSNDPPMYMDRYGVVYDHAPRGFSLDNSIAPTEWANDVSIDVQNKSTKFTTGIASTIVLAVRNNGQEEINGEAFRILFVTSGLSDTTITPKTSTHPLGAGALNNSYRLSVYTDNEYVKVYTCSSNLVLKPFETGYFVFDVVHAGAMDNFQLSTSVVPTGDDDDSANNHVNIQFSK
jgi:hypothetical protein